MEFELQSVAGGETGMATAHEPATSSALGQVRATAVRLLSKDEGHENSEVPGFTRDNAGGASVSHRLRACQHHEVAGASPCQALPAAVFSQAAPQALARSRTRKI